MIHVAPLNGLGSSKSLEELKENLKRGEYPRMLSSHYIISFFREEWFTGNKLKY